MPADADEAVEDGRPPSQASTERTPLLDLEDAVVAEEAAEDPHVLYRQNVIILVFAGLFLVEVAIGMIMPPLTEILEGIICRQYHPDALGNLLPSDPDSICKSPDVQQRLAMIRGWAVTFDCIVGIITAIPYGVLSDSWGRRPVVFLAIAGVNLQVLGYAVVIALPDMLPVWTIWLTSIVLLVGGGVSIANAMLYTMIADVVPVANRATVFFQLGAVALIAALVANPLTAVIMARSPWLAFFIGQALLLLALAVIFVLPETRHLHKQARKQHAEQHASNGYSHTEAHLADGDQPRAPPTGHLQEIVQHIRYSAVGAKDFVMANQRVTFLIMSLALIVVGRWVQEMLLQYSTRRYHWTWSQATYLLAVGSASNLVVLMGILPAISWVLVTRCRMPGVTKDLILARASGFMLLVGALIIGFAVNWRVLVFGQLIWAGGAGQSSLIRSLANALTEEHHIGILNTLVSLMDQVALMIAGPLLSTTLSAGFRMGGLWVGLPFFCAAGMFSLAWLVTMAFRLPAGRTEGVVGPVEQENGYTND